MSRVPVEEPPDGWGRSKPPPPPPPRPHPRAQEIANEVDIKTIFDHSDTGKNAAYHARDRLRDVLRRLDHAEDAEDFAIVRARIDEITNELNSALARLQDDTPYARAISNIRIRARVIDDARNAAVTLANLVGGTP